jgi:glycerophosphoryl diester phosphodiesterase
VSYHPQIFAHRGANHSAPENTLPAFNLAHEQKADGLECDIQLSKDNIAVLWHDETLERLDQPTKAIRDFTWAELQNFNASSLCEKYSKRASILRLDDFLINFSHSTQLLLEIKLETKATEAHQLQKIKETIRLIKDFVSLEKQKTLYVSSFDQNTLMTIHQQAPHLQLILNCKKETTPQDILCYHKNMPYLKGICLNIDILTQANIAKAQGLNWLTAVYTCNHDDELRKALAVKIDIIITDYPKKSKAKIRQIINKS